MKRFVIALAAALFLTGCATAPGDDIADKFVEAETRDERVTRINGFAAIVMNFAVSKATPDDFARVRLFGAEINKSLDGFDAEPLFVESNIMRVVQIFGRGARGEIAKLIGTGGIPSVSEMLGYIKDLSMASAMLRDVAWIMKEVQSGGMTADAARDAFRRHIDNDLAKIPA